MREILKINLLVWKMKERLEHAIAGKKTHGRKNKIGVRDMATLKDAIAELKQTVADAVTAVDKAVVSLANGAIPPADVQAIVDSSATLKAETDKLNTALGA